MAKDQHMKTVEKNHVALMARLAEIERKADNLRVFVRELRHAMERMEKRR